MSSGWLPRLLKAWVRWRMELLVLPPAVMAAPPAAAAAAADGSKLRGPSCSGTFLISMLSLRSTRGAPEPSAAGGERGEEDEEEGVGVPPAAAAAADDLLL